jgi:hypothetical protein
MDRHRHMHRRDASADPAVMEDGRIPCGRLRPRPLNDRIDVAYVDSLLCRVLPFEAWLIRERYGLYDPPRDGRTADDVGFDCGLSQARIREIEGRALIKMLDMQRTLSAD